MARILVLDGHSAAALAFARSLGKHGHWVAVGHAAGMFAAAVRSRYCQTVFEYPDSTKDVSGFHREVLRFIENQQIELLFPITDWTTAPVSRYREEVERHCQVALPCPEALELAADKYRTIELAASVEVPVPETWLIRRADELDALPPLAYPVVVKDRESARWIENGAVFGAVSYAYNREDLRRKVERRLEAAGDVLVQKFAGGKGIGFSCFAHQGEVYLPFQWLRLRETDPRGSASSARRSMPVDPQVLEFSRRLMRGAGFEGLAMVEFKQDPASSQLTLMEINGRPWGSIQLPIFSGIDYPNYAVDWYLGRKLPPVVLNYKQGIICRRLLGELNHLDSLRQGKPPEWPTPYPNFWTSLIKIAVPWYPGMRYDDLWLSDPRPGLAGLGHWFEVRLKRKKKASTSGKRKIRGIIHCHSTYSYDGKLELAELCDLLRREGFDFVALTEHTQGLTDARYQELTKECQAESDHRFLAVPGIEFRCDDGVEIAGIGLPSWIEDSQSSTIAAAIRSLGGFSIWVHPFKHGAWPGVFPDCDAVELLNGKVNGTLAPDFALRKAYGGQRRQGRSFHAIFGLDFHNLRQPRQVWAECEVEELSQPALLGALREGRFVNAVTHGTMSSTGEIQKWDYCKMLVLQWAFLAWGTILRGAPRGLRNTLLSLSRPVVRLLKRDH